VSLVERVGALLERHTSRRGFLVRASVVGSALAVDPLEFLLRPRSAYAVVCKCGNPACGCNSACCDGYTEFCCTLYGTNTCPSGTFAGGWWQADGSAYCPGPRYYIDCHAECQCTDGCTPGGPSYCSPTCDGLDCDCAMGSCEHRIAGCVSFRYGQCHQEIACAGRIACRVVTCTPAYLIDNSCTTTSMSDDLTAQHNAPCLQAPPVVVRAYGFAAAASGGYWLVARDGGVFAYESAPYLGSMGGKTLNAPMAGIVGTHDGQGYWLVAADGGVFAFGSALYLGSMGGKPLDAPMVGIARTPDSQGYWLVAADGGVFAYGAAIYFGSTGGQALQAPIVALTPALDGQGYWLVAADGGVFAYGSAAYHGGKGGLVLNALIAGLVPTPSGQGYWLVGQDGSVYPFGDAPDFGDYRRNNFPAPVLPANGIDAFYGLTVHVAAPPSPDLVQSLLGQSPPGPTADGYRLVAAAPLGPPPTVHDYTFGNVR
jgi:hypothetical protein